jgi:phosphoesterase RecJ-like protein
MQSYPEAEQIAAFIHNLKSVLIIQADNPDGDSLASALALEAIMSELGIEPLLYCAVDMPAHLHYLHGWDRVSRELPASFDGSIIVDTSSISLLEHLQQSGEISTIKHKPLLIIDHHTDSGSSIDFATISCLKPAVSTGEIIYELATQLSWPLPDDASAAIAVSILSDSLGLMTVATTARTIHIIAELVAGGVNLPQLETARRDMMRKSPALVHYKGELLQRVRYHADDRVATLIIPWAEIEHYSALYNPSVLALDEMRLTENTAIAIAFKVYKDGKITGKLRANYGTPIATKLAEHFGGGGHPYASGFKIVDGRSIADVEAECVTVATELLDSYR